MIDRGLLAAQTLLLLELLIEAKHGALLVGTHVSCAATARSKVACGGRGGELDARCWACGGAAIGYLRSLYTGNIASATATRVEVGIGRRVGLGDVEVDHVGYCDVALRCLGVGVLECWSVVVFVVVVVVVVVAAIVVVAVVVVIVVAEGQLQSFLLVDSGMDAADG